MTTERHCFECFESTGLAGRKIDSVGPCDMDVLVLGNRLLRKAAQPLLAGAEAYKRSFRPD